MVRTVSQSYFIMNSPYSNVTSAYNETSYEASSQRLDTVDYYLRPELKISEYLFCSEIIKLWQHVRDHQRRDLENR